MVMGKPRHKQAPLRVVLRSGGKEGEGGLLRWDDTTLQLPSVIHLCSI